MFFVILVTHPKSYIETTDRRDFGGKPSKWRLRPDDGCYREKFLNFVLCSVGSHIQNSIFSRFYGTLRLSCAQPTGNSFAQTNKVPMESRDSEGVRLLLAWRVCDQAFGSYRPLKGAEKWSRDHHEN